MRSRAGSQICDIAMERNTRTLSVAALLCLFSGCAGTNGLQISNLPFCGSNVCDSCADEGCGESGCLMAPCEAAPLLLNLDACDGCAKAVRPTAVVRVQTTATAAKHVARTAAKVAARADVGSTENVPAWQAASNVARRTFYWMEPVGLLEFLPSYCCGTQRWTTTVFPRKCRLRCNATCLPTG